MSSLLTSVANGQAWKDPASGSFYYPIGNTGCVDSIVQAWSGAAFDYATNTMHICCGGGHGDGWSNECFALQIPGGSWVKTAAQTPFPPDQHIPGVYEPVEWANKDVVGAPLTPGDGYNPDMTPHPFPCAPTVDHAVVYFDGHPCSRHTMGGTIWLPVQQRVLLMGGSCWPLGPGDWYCGWFNPTSGSWTRKANLPRSGSKFTTYDFTRNLVIWKDANVGDMYTYNPATDTHHRFGPVSGSDYGGIHSQIVVAGGYVYCTASTPDWGTPDFKGPQGSTGFVARGAPSNYANSILRMPLLGETSPLQNWEVVKVYGDTTGMYSEIPGMEYDPDKNAIVFWAFDDPGHLSVLRLNDFHINRVAIRGTPPPTQNPVNPAARNSEKGVFGRFRRYGTHQYCVMTSPSLPVYLITLQ